MLWNISELWVDLWLSTCLGNLCLGGHWIWKVFSHLEQNERCDLRLLSCQLALKLNPGWSNLLLYQRFPHELTLAFSILITLVLFVWFLIEHLTSGAIIELYRTDPILLSDVLCGRCKISIEWILQSLRHTHRVWNDGMLWLPVVCIRNERLSLNSWAN